MRCLAAVLVVGAALGGCITQDDAPGADGEAAGSDPDGAADAVLLEFDAHGCVEVTLVVPVEMDHAQSLLPEGFTAGDATGLFGLPGLTGRGAVLVTSASCPSTSMGDAPYEEAIVGIVVEDPGVPTATAASGQLYELGRALSPGPVREAAAGAGWALFGDAARAEVVGPPVPGGRGAASDAGTDVYTIEVTGAGAAARVSGTFRWWQVVPAGVAYFDYTLAADGATGIASCTLSDGSAAALAVGATSCAPGSAAPVVAPPFDVAVRFELLPGASV